MTTPMTPDELRDLTALATLDADDLASLERVRAFRDQAPMHVVRLLAEVGRLRGAVDRVLALCDETEYGTDDSVYTADVRRALQGDA